jgi:hypothetical protein
MLVEQLQLAQQVQFKQVQFGLLHLFPSPEPHLALDDFVFIILSINLLFFAF